MSALAEQLNPGLCEALYPSEPIPLDVWADRYRILTTKATAEAGRWRTDRTPYLREIMRWLSPSSPVQLIWVQKGHQLGFTELLINFIGYTIHHSPAPTLFVQPTKPLMRRTVKQRIDPMIEAVPEVRALLPDRLAKTGGNSMTEKDFPGGVCIFAGANSAAEVCSSPIQNGIGDEIDRFPLDCEGEGSTVALIRKRTSTFRNRKEIYGSTPTVHGLSQIEAGIAGTEQSKYFVPCPECGHYQVIEWERIRWTSESSDVWLECEAHNCRIEETQKPTMLAHGEWRATMPDNFNPRVRGVIIDSLSAPLGWYSWKEARDDYVKSEGPTEANRQDRKAFVNTVLARTTRPDGESPNWERLFARRANYAIGTVPEGGLILTAAVDVQQDRLECEVVAWGRNLWSWSIEYLVFPGDPLDIDGPRSPWRKVEELLGKDYKHDLGGTVRIRKLAVDTGFSTQTIYRWARKTGDPRIALIKGSADIKTPIGAATRQDVKENGQRIRRGVVVWSLGVNVIKETLFASLRRDLDDPEHPPTRWVHFPQYSEEYFRQLCAEELQTTVNRKGWPVQAWVKTRERNEALDTQVYNRAASIIAGLDRMTEKHFLALEEAASVVRDEDAPTPPPPKKKRSKGPRRPSIWESRHG